MPDRRSIVVFGAGAVGCYLGGTLALAFERDAALPSVSLVGRSRIVDAIRREGLTLCREGTKTVLHPVAVSSAAGLPPADLVIVAVRAFDLESAIPDISALLGETGSLLAMQNGVGSEEMLARALGRERLLVGTTTVSVGMAEPGVVRRNSRSGGVALATMSGKPVPPWITQVFRTTGLPTTVVEDYRTLRWSKLLLNMLGAVACAVLDVDLPLVVSHASLFRMEQLAFREAGGVMDAHGIGTMSLPGYPVPIVRLVMRLPRSLAQRTLAPRLKGARGGRPPTMRADMARGRTEVAYLNGAVAREAATLGLGAPVNTALTWLAQDLTQHPERRAGFQGRPERLIAYMRECGVRL